MITFVIRENTPLAVVKGGITNETPRLRGARGVNAL